MHKFDKIINLKKKSFTEFLEADYGKNYDISGVIKEKKSITYKIITIKNFFANL